MRDLNDHAMIIGGSAAIAHAGWTTQFQLMPDILTGTKPIPVIGGARVRGRTPAIMAKLSEWISPHISPDWGIPVLVPAMAIADAWLDRSGVTHMYDPDDFDPDAVDEAQMRRLPEALAALGAGPKQIEECVARYKTITSVQARSGFGNGPY